MEDSKKKKIKELRPRAGIVEKTKPKPGHIPRRTQPKGSNTDPRNIRYPVRGSSIAINMES